MIFLLFGASPLSAQTIATSAGPERVGVTIYRDPGREPARRPNLNWLGGYALITETRRVSVPAGEVELRFEGVAGGIIPASAIVSGLPDGVLERNRDARLLSPGALVDASLGRRVTVRRTSRATGEVRLVDAVVRSGPDEALVLETAEGTEALRCSGLPETLVFPEVPPGLSARPTLSVRTRAARAWGGEVTLSYLATGFDWTASYVARLHPAGDRLDLLAWVTLANGDETGFREAETQAVAGRVNREATPRDVGEAKGLTLRCWPQGTTSDTGELNVFSISDEEIVVTGSRVSRADAAFAPPPPPPAPAVAMEAVQEELGDLKLYRIPEPVTVAARSQKQVAMLQRPAVRVAQFYRTRINGLGVGITPPTLRMLRTTNVAASGLGLPLPGGRLALHADGPGRSVLIGQGSLPDYAVGEEVEIEAGAVTGIVAGLTRRSVNGEDGDWELAVTNDMPRPVPYEVEFPLDSRATGEGWIQRHGRSVWRGTLPANGRITIRLPG